jgi:BolA family transcriptional regulator, general stress-responsive regulator
VNQRVDKIRALLSAALNPLELEISDDSHKHAGHEGAKSGGGHFSAKIVSSAFSTLPLLARHRLVYRALAPMMPDEIHAFSMKVLSPDENH